MANFLVRETLGYEEFAEALQRLWEERNGVDPSELNFGLPPEEEDPWETWWYDDGYEDTAASTAAADDAADPPVHIGQRPAEGERSEEQLKDRITPHVTNFFRLRLTIEKQEGKRKYKSDGAVMVGEFVCMYVCSCTVSE